MTVAAFKAAHLRGMRASPFAGDPVLLSGDARIPLPGCVVAANDNQPQAEEYGIERSRTLHVQIPKELLVDAPRPNRDMIDHADVKYAIQTVTGGEEHSAVWVVFATAPL